MRHRPPLAALSWSRPVLAFGALLLASSGCLTILDVDDGAFSQQDGGAGDADATLEPGLDGSLDGTVNGHDGDMSVTDGNTPDRSLPPDDLCTGSGWHRDCTFGDAGFVMLAPSDLGATPPVTAVDPAANVYIVAAMTGPGGSPGAFIVTITTETVSPPTSVSSVAPVVDVRVLIDGELALLSNDTDTSAATASRIDAGRVVESVNVSVVSPPLVATAVRFVDVDGSTWTAGGSSSDGSPTVITFDMAHQTASSKPGMPRQLAPTGAVAVGNEVYFIGAAPPTGMSDPYAEIGPTTMMNGTCTTDSGAVFFSDITAVDDQPLGVTAETTGFSFRELTFATSCPPRAVYDGAYYGQTTQVRVTRGIVHGADALVVVGHTPTQAADFLVVAHAVIQDEPDGSDQPFPVTFASGAAAGIDLGANAVTLGAPALTGSYLYVPFLAYAGAEAGVTPSELMVVRLVYGP